MSIRWSLAVILELGLVGLFVGPITAAAQSPGPLAARTEEPFEWPRPETELPIPVEHERMHRADGYYGVGEFISWGPVQKPEIYPSLPAQMAEICPYLEELARKNCKSADGGKPESCTPLDNLERLEIADTAYKLGEFLSQWQHPLLAEICYELAFRLCPGSRIEKMAAQRLENSPFGSGADLRMTEQINQSEDLQEVYREWARFWFQDHPSNLQPEELTALPHPPSVAARPVPKREPKTKQVQLSITIAEVPRGRFLKEDQHVKVLKPAARDKLLARIQKLRHEGKAKFLGEPRIVTTSGHSASFLDGGERVMERPDGLAQVGVQFEEFGTRLTMKPTVLAKGKLQLEVEPEISRLDPTAGSTVNGEFVPGRTTQRMQVSFELKSGQTVAISGLQTCHGDQKKSKKRETIILVTPRIVGPKQKKPAEIERKLQKKVTVGFADKPLKKVLADFQALHGIRIVPDQEALDEELISLDQSITMQLDGVPLKAALNLILRDAKLTYVVRDDSVVVTTEGRARGKPVARTYVISDLLERDLLMRGTFGALHLPIQQVEEPDQLVELVRNSIAPRSWDGLGGSGKICYLPLANALVVEQTPDIQEQVQDLLSALRRLKEMPEPPLTHPGK